MIPRPRGPETAPDMRVKLILPALTEAGVVDAGGQGLYVLFDGRQVGLGQVGEPDRPGLFFPPLQNLLLPAQGKEFQLAFTGKRVRRPLPEVVDQGFEFGADPAHVAVLGLQRVVL